MLWMRDTVYKHNDVVTKEIWWSLFNGEFMANGVFTK